MHGAVDAVPAIDLDPRKRLIKSLFHSVVFSRSKPSQDVGDHVMTGIGSVNAHAQTVKVSGPQDSGYGSQSVVTCQAAPFFKPDPAQGQIELVMDNQNVRRGDFPMPEHLEHSPTAQVHEGQRFEEKPGIAEDRSPFPENEILFGFRRQLGTSGFALNESVHDHEPEIVSGSVVLTTGIPKTYDETGVSHGILTD
jgi:hypothetical protein